MTTTRPRGRRPGRVDTRAEILAAALTLFSEVGYEKVSLRAVARSAEVDPALVHHYFASKSELFTEAVLALPIADAPQTVAAILDGPVSGVGERAAGLMLAALSVPQAKEKFSAMLRAAVSGPGTHRPLSEFLAKEIYSKVAESLGHSDAKQRGELAVSAILGFVLTRDLLGLPTLVKGSRARMTTALGRALQAHLADPL